MVTIRRNHCGRRGQISSSLAHFQRSNLSAIVAEQTGELDEDQIFAKLLDEIPQVALQIRGAILLCEKKISERYGRAISEEGE